VADTKIEWANKVINPVAGCTKVSPGCANCYAENMAYARGDKNTFEKYEDVVDDKGRWTGTVTVNLSVMEDVLKWKKPRRIFVCSMGDLFHDNVPFEFVERVFNIISLNQKHNFLVLTKRPERMEKFFKQANYNGFNSDSKPLPNIWLGVSVENQQTADERIPILLQIPATVRWISVEPMLGPIFLPSQWMDYGRYGQYGVPTINWIVCGGESGPGARPMHPEWAKNLRDQCKAADVRFLFKQHGEFKEVCRYNSWPKYSDGVGSVSRAIGGRGALLNADGSDLVNGGPDHKVYPISHLERVGKKNAGRLLDGAEHNEYPVMSCKT
jgi:protein gp37